MPEHPPDNRGPIIFLVLLVMVGLIVVAWDAGQVPADEPRYDGSVQAPPRVEPSPSPVEASSSVVEPVQTQLPGGGRRIFAGSRFLVAYYGTGQTPALGVLGETDPATMDRRLRRAAAPYRRPGQPLRRVYELIVTVADGRPGRDGDYSHDIPRSEVRRYLRAAHRNDALLVLDVQPGRSGFLDVAKRWAWALKDPWVGLALDPEWRMGPHQIPARTIGQVSAAEVNRTSAWLSRLTRRDRLPEKLFVLHEFRRDMVLGMGKVQRRPGLATVQHVDGYGTPRQKLATYHHVARPRQFTMGFKLFYDEDVRRLDSRAVLAIRPRVRFVSYQ